MLSVIMPSVVMLNVVVLNVVMLNVVMLNVVAPLRHPFKYPFTYLILAPNILCELMKGQVDKMTRGL